MFATIGLIVICIPFIWWYLFLNKYKSLDIIPGPRPIPFIGNALALGKCPQDLFKNILNLYKQYGEIFKIYVANEVKVFISNADFFEQILSSQDFITKSDAYALLRPFLNVGLLTSSGERWRTHRKMITPTFHFKILEEFLEIFNKNGDILVRKLAKEVGKTSVDIHQYIDLFSLDVICETAMGVKISTQEGKNLEYNTALRNYWDILIARAFSPWKKFDTLFKFAPEYLQQEHNLKVLLTFSTQMIQQKRAEKVQEMLKPKMSDDGIKRKMALLDLLLENEDNNTLTTDDIEGEINTFMFAGHDTVSNSLSFTLLALAENETIQAEVYDEVMTVVAQESCITPQHLREVKYLEMVIKEAQRMYCTVPFVERRLEADVNICGINFPKDTTLSLYLAGIHQNEKYYPNPHIFDPQRFSQEAQTQRHNFAFVPFSAGPRNCIGQKFAMMDMKVTVIKVLQKYQILPVDNYKPELGMAAVLKSYNGICVRLKNRSVNC